ncbi:MAG: tetratricopeptide repeat protein [Spirochaetota bacterium]
MRKKLASTFFLLFISVFTFAAFDSKVMLNQGLEAFRAGNYSSAELLFRRTVEFNDDNRDRAWFYLARSIFQQGKYSSALFEFNTFLTKCRTESLRIESRFWMGESYFNLKQNLKAIEEYKRFLEKSKDTLLNVNAHDRIGTIYYNQQRYEEAVIEWENAIKESEDKEQNAILILKIGQAFFANEEYDKAHERLYPLITSRIDSKSKAEIRITLGQIFQHQDDHRQALTIFNAIPRDLANIYPYHDMYYFRALSYLKLERTASAKADLELFYMIGKKSQYYYDGIFELGQILLDTNKTDNGLELLVKVWEESDKKELTVKSGIILAQNLIEKDPERAILYTEKFIKIENEESKKKLYILLSRAYIKAGRNSEAEELLNQYAKLFPYDLNIDEVNFYRARILLDKGDTDKAVEIFESIKKDNPFSKFLNESDYYLGLVNFKRNKFSEAINHLNKYLSRKDEVVNRYEAILLLIEIHMSNGDTLAAERQVKVLINQYIAYKNVDEAIYNFALKLNEKKPASAKSYFSIILNRFPDSEYSMLVTLHYGNEAFASGNYSRAIPYYEKFLNSNVNKNSGLAFFNLIKSYYNISNFEKVTEIIGKSKIPPLDEAQWKELPLIHARSYYKMEQYPNVYRVLKWEDIVSFPDDDAYMFVDSTIQTGDIINAESLVSKIKDKSAVYGKALELLANYYKEENNYQKAEQLFIDILNSDTSADVKNRSRISLAIILRDNSNFTESDKYLNQIEDASFFADKYSLLIVNLFLSGNEKSGTEVSLKRIEEVKKSRHREDVVKLNILYYYNFKDLKLFNFYTSLLQKNKDNNNLVEYLSGRLAYDTGNFNKAYSHFNKLSTSDNVYKSESNYYLGTIGLLFYKNRNTAIRFFNRAIEDENSRSEFVQKSKLNLAVIYNESKNYSLSKQFLNEIISESSRGRFRIEAENLWQYFNY